MTLRTRLILTITGIAILLVIPAAYGVTQLNELENIASEQRSRHGLAYEAVGALQARLSELDRVARAYVIDPDSALRAAMYDALALTSEPLSQLDSANYSEAAAAARVRLDSIGNALAAVDSIMLIAIAAPSSGVAQEIRTEGSEYFETVKPQFDEARETMNALGGEVDRRSAADLRQASQIAAGAVTTTAIALSICLSIAVALGIWTTRALTRPVMRLRHAMALVADGIFRVPENLPYERQDEIGSVSRSFRAMTHRLADLDRLKAEFMSISTHELKTPINVISGYAELMYERVYGDLSDKQDEALSAIRDQTRVLTQLVNQLLDVSRLEAGGLRLHFRPVSLVDLFRRVERSFEGLAHRKQIAFAVEIDASVPETIHADAERLSDQVLGNLISNALKFTSEGGRITVRTWLEEGALRIEVEDTGTGIPPDKLPYIFDKFYQVGEQARSKGAGLGLAIAHEVVEAHGGTIHAESVVDQGTRFLIEIPVRQEVEEESAVVGAPVHAGEAG
jgi:signal transduction histidine kinase